MSIQKEESGDQEDKVGIGTLREAPKFSFVEEHFWWACFQLMTDSWNINFMTKNLFFSIVKNIFIIYIF